MSKNDIGITFIESSILPNIWDKTVGNSFTSLFNTRGFYSEIERKTGKNIDIIHHVKFMRTHDNKCVKEIIGCLRRRNTSGAKIEHSLIHLQKRFFFLLNPLFIVASTSWFLSNPDLFGWIGGWGKK